ncbi:MAG: hypothetical protein ACRDHU_00665 [Actinomycetota bacterium]
MGMSFIVPDPQEGEMSATDTMRWMGRSARGRAHAVGHSMKDRVLEKRLERTTDEADRLRLENDMLRDEVAETRTEHQRILDVLETRLSEAESGTKKTHRGRWVLFLMALGGGAYAIIRTRTAGNGHGEWEADDRTGPAVTQTSTATI